MADHKSTTISGTRYGAPTHEVPAIEGLAFFVYTVRAGHWKPDAALRLARRMGAHGMVKVRYAVNAPQAGGYGDTTRVIRVDEDSLANAG